MTNINDASQHLLTLRRLVREAEEHHRHKRWEQFHTALRAAGYATRDASVAGYEEEQRLARLERLT